MEANRDIKGRKTKAFSELRKWWLVFNMSLTADKNDIATKMLFVCIQLIPVSERLQLFKHIALFSDIYNAT